MHLFKRHRTHGCLPVSQYSRTRTHFLSPHIRTNHFRFTYRPGWLFVESSWRPLYCRQRRRTPKQLDDMGYSDQPIYYLIWRHTCAPSVLLPRRHTCTNPPSKRNRSTLEAKYYFRTKSKNRLAAIDFHSLKFHLTIPHSSNLSY